MVRLKHEPETSERNLKGPCVVVIHAKWCGHCKDFMPVFDNQIVPSNSFDEELKDLLTLTSVEDKEYSDAKELFGEIDGYPTIRYITFDEVGKPLKDNNGAIMKIDAVNIPRKAKDITEWINTVVKRDIKEKHKSGDSNKHNNNNKHAHGMRGGGGGGGGSKRVKRVRRTRTRKTKKVVKKVVKRLVKRTKRIVKRGKRI
jgi:thiol-disulfide isomerase/thioredoxin